MKVRAKSTIGRPRGFDREAALEIAMRLFWRHGFEGVSLQQLTSAIGVAAPSLYAAFGNKESLFREALERYLALRGASDLSFLDRCQTLREAVRAVLEGTADGLVDPAGEVGCMLNTGMITSHPDHTSVARELAERRSAYRSSLAAGFQRWVC